MSIPQENHQHYPTLFHHTMDILPIQGSSVPCEQVFLLAKETMAPHQNHMSTKMMEALQILKYSFQYGQDLNFTEVLGWDDKLVEIERAHQFQLHTPEDLDSFIASLGLDASESSSNIDSELDAALDME